MYNNTSNVIGSFFISYFSSSYVYTYIYIYAYKKLREKVIERDTKTSIIMYNTKKRRCVSSMVFPSYKIFFGALKIENLEMLQMIDANFKKFSSVTPAYLYL